MNAPTVSDRSAPLGPRVTSHGIDRAARLARRIRVLVIVFMAGLILSGLTAFPLTIELRILRSFLGIDPAVSPGSYSGLQHWIATAAAALQEIDVKYPFIAYGTDWLAFAHLVIAVAFIGPLRV